MAKVKYKEETFCGSTRLYLQPIEILEIILPPGVRRIDQDKDGVVVSTKKNQSRNVDNE